MLVALSSTIKKLIQEGLNHLIWECALMVIQQLLQVLIKEFKHEGELLVSMEHVYKSNNIWMLQLFEQGNFSDGSTWNTFFFRFKSDTLQSINFTSVYVFGLVHDTVGSFTYLFELLVLINFRLHFTFFCKV